MTKRRQQRAPILDPWSDELPPSEPATRTHNRLEAINLDDKDVITSAPPLDQTLKKKPPLPPPKRSATLTGTSGTMLAVMNEVAPESRAAPAAAPAQASAPAGQASAPPAPPAAVAPTAAAAPAAAPATAAPATAPATAATTAAPATAAPAPAAPAPESRTVPQAPPPPTRKPTLTPRAPSTASFQAVQLPPTAAPRIEDVPRSERKSVPPPPPPRPPSASQVALESALETGMSQLEVKPTRDVRTEPPPPTMPAAAAHTRALASPAPSVASEPAPTPPAQEGVVAPAPPPTIPSNPPPEALEPTPSPTRRSSLPPKPASVPPKPASVPPPAPRAPSVPPPRPQSSIPPVQRAIGGVPLEQIEAFADLPGDMQRLLCDRAAVSELNLEEEVPVTGAVLVLSGAAVICPTIADAAAHHLASLALVPALTSRTDVTKIRVVATDACKLASWDRASLEEALKSCPWVLDELRQRSDRYAALAGATMGPLGDLDEASRIAAMDRLTVRALAPGETWLEGGADLPGLTIVGSGALSLEDEGASFSTGDVVMPDRVLEGGKVGGAVRAGAEGALLLGANRMVTLELFSILPGLLELLRVA